MHMLWAQKRTSCQSRKYSFHCSIAGAGLWWGGKDGLARLPLSGDVQNWNECYAFLPLTFYRKLDSYNYTSKVQPENFDLKSIPFRFHLDDINSQFVRLYFFLDMDQIPKEDRWEVAQKKYVIANSQCLFEMKNLFLFEITSQVIPCPSYWTLAAVPNY